MDNESLNTHFRDVVAKNHTTQQPALSPAEVERCLAQVRAAIEQRPTASGAHLLVAVRDAEPYWLPLAQESLTIGRQPDNHLQLSVQPVSGYHCRLHRKDDAWWLEDLESKNGTRVNGNDVRHTPLSDGDVIGIGTVSLLFVQN